MAGITPLNNFLGPESDPVTVATQLPKYQRSSSTPSLVRECEARRQVGVGGRERERGDAEGDVQNNFLN